MSAEADASISLLLSHEILNILFFLISYFLKYCSYFQEIRYFCENVMSLLFLHELVNKHFKLLSVLVSDMLKLIDMSNTNF